MKPLPAWAEIVVLPLVNVALAFLTVGIIVRVIGVDPLHALRLLVVGAVGSSESIGYTLYYTTNFIFTGLAVAVAFHAGLFNIGGEGQAYIGGLGCGLSILAFDGLLPAPLMIPLAIAAAALFGAAWAAVPGWLQAWRGSHIVITTIMFNFLASALMVYLMVDVLIAPGSMTPQSRSFAASGKLPSMQQVLALFGIPVAPSALNLSLVLAVLCCVGVWLFLWHTSRGYALRTMGHNPEAARYAGIDLRRMTMLAMGLSGALAGGVGVNELMGVHQRIVLDFPAGYGFAGIAVALMGRGHPLGIALAALLFGALQQGGAELSFDIPAITREMVVVIQGLVILFCGALVNMPRPWLAFVFSSKFSLFSPSKLSLLSPARGRGWERGLDEPSQPPLLTSPPGGGEELEKKSEGAKP